MDEDPFWDERWEAYWRVHVPLVSTKDDPGVITASEDFDRLRLLCFVADPVGFTHPRDD